jgi:hypothetical protein
VITNKARILAAALAIALITSVCNLPDFTPATPDPGEVIIPPTTKILDANTLVSLETVNPDGTLTFTSSSPSLQQLAAGDVIVADSSNAAPRGLLRKVVAVRTEGERVIVQTEGAKITEAVHQGRVVLEQELKAEDIRATRIYQPGVRFEGVEMVEDGPSGYTRFLFSPSGQAS